MMQPHCLSGGSPKASDDFEQHQGVGSRWKGMSSNANNRFFHICVRCEHGEKTLTQHDVARWLWSRLRRSFPDALAAVLMQDHIHVLAPAVNESDARRRLAAVVSAIRRSNNAGADIVFSPTSAKGPFMARQKLARQVRYIMLNPCRAGYARCPLQWLWTTQP